MVRDPSLRGKERREASLSLARSSVRNGNDITVVVNDIVTFASEPYTYRRAMIDYYIKDNDVIRRNPILHTGYTTEEVEQWYQWAVNNQKDGILINFK